MRKDFSIGDRIRVSAEYHWAKGVLGTVMQPPGYVVNFAHRWDGIHREVPSLKGMLIFYWIKFGPPQIDADGDGPYAEAEIDSDYLLQFESQD
jgi:hypothetical protein